MCSLLLTTEKAKQDMSSVRPQKRQSKTCQESGILLHVTAEVQLHMCRHTQLVINKGVQAGCVSCSKLALEGLITLQAGTSCLSSIPALQLKMHVDAGAAMLPGPTSTGLKLCQ